MKSAINSKMDNMTVDSAPASGSSNLVTSGGVYTAINGKAVSDVAMAVDADNNLSVTVKQADGTSKSGSVELPVPQAGEIPVEYYTSDEGRIDWDVYPTKSVTFSESITISTSTSASKRFVITDYEDDVTNSDGLYYDSDNNVMRRVVTVEHGNVRMGSSSISTLRYTTLKSGTNYTAIVDAFSWLIGKSIGDTNNGLITSSSSLGVAFKLNSSIVIGIKLTIASGVITALGEIQVFSETTSTSISGTYKVYWVTDNSTTYSSKGPWILDTMPSTYTQIVTL